MSQLNSISREVMWHLYNTVVSSIEYEGPHLTDASLYPIHKSHNHGKKHNHKSSSLGHSASLYGCHFMRLLLHSSTHTTEKEPNSLTRRMERYREKGGCHHNRTWDDDVFYKNMVMPHNSDNFLTMTNNWSSIAMYVWSWPINITYVSWHYHILVFAMETFHYSAAIVAD